MEISVTRRSVLTAALSGVAISFASRAFTQEQKIDIVPKLKSLEARSGGKLGVAVLDTATGNTVGNRLDEHFALCSTFKALVIAQVLARVDRGQERLDRRIHFSERDLVLPYKATKPNVGAVGMTIEELCKAAATYSDSTAANLLLASCGGPAALTAYLRSMGDTVTRLDKIEPELNIVRSGDVHDTTSPRAMAETMKRIVLGDALSDPSRQKIAQWLEGGKDAATQRLRMGLPAGWRIANKPGTWERISTNDVGVIWPPHRPPVIVAAYLGYAPGTVKSQEAVLADVARIVAAAL